MTKSILAITLILALYVSTMYYFYEAQYQKARADEYEQFIKCMNWEHQYRGIYSSLKAVCFERIKAGEQY
jgi:superoxide dismutase